MARRDFSLCAAFLLILFIPFSRLLLSPNLVPGNFGDIYGYHYPLRHLVTSTLQEGRLPLWNPYIFVGTPLAANPQAVLFYPVSVIHYFLPLAWSFSLEMFGHLFFAWLGAYLLLRKWRLDRTGAWTLALAYGLSPFVVLRIPQGIPTHLAALAWIPWIWLCAQSPYRLLWSLALALQILSGHPQFALLNLLALGLWALCRRPKLVPWLVAGALMSLAIDWAQAGATLQFLSHSVRAYWGAGFSLGYSLKPSYLLTFIHPNALGNPFQKDFALYPSEYFEMLTAYIGLIPLFLALVGLTVSRAPWALIAAGIFFGLGENNPLYVPLQKFLGLDFLRVPARFSIVIILGLWLAAISGWRTLWSKAGPWEGSRLPMFKMIFLVLASLDLIFWSFPWIYFQNASQIMTTNPAVLSVIRNPAGRIATSPDLPSANKAMLYRIGNVTGYEAFYLAPIAVYTSMSEGQAAADGSRTYIRKWQTPAMARLGLRYYLASEPVAGYAPRSHEGPTYIYEDRKAQPIVQGAKTWEVRSAERYDAWSDKPGSVVFAQANYPGWKAWVNGTRVPVLDDHGLFPRVELKGSGPWTIHFEFLPGLWFFGVFVSLISFFGVAVGSFRRKPESRKTRLDPGFRRGDGNDQE
jgi:hypothetical protein